MLCITHLSEHDQYIKEQIQSQTELKHLWNEYIKMFNEEQIQREIESLNIKLENYQKLKENVNNLLSTDCSDQSIDQNEKLQKAIEKVQDAIAQENRSKSMPCVCSEMTNNKEGDTRQVAVIDQIHTINCCDLVESRILDFSSDSSDEKGPVVTSESDWGSDNVFSPAVDKKHGEEILSSSKNFDTYNECDQTNRANEQSVAMNATASPSDKVPETQNMSPLIQEAFQKPESTNSSEDAHNFKQSSAIKFDTQSSEESYY
ncbi:unnamed protein product [Adineta steineri]|uniref:Uncharacterized protein n=1 Tax=Adineta steineri TaxID=433720 RepID=A0A814IF24_9BILA|nr:unnamed protein product [Adineta steineri]CAF3665213.1 unnamed protein product [Adineta steineri]